MASETIKFVDVPTCTDSLHVGKPAGVTNEKAPRGSPAGLCVWWRFRDSNPGPVDYDSIALTN